MKKTNILGIILMLVMSMAIIFGYWAKEAVLICEELKQVTAEDEGLGNWMRGCYTDIINEGYVDSGFISDGYLYHAYYSGILDYDDFEVLVCLKISSYLWN